MAEKRPTPVKPLTIYFYHTRLTRESYEEWKDYKFPGHILYGLPLLEKYGIRSVMHKYKAFPGRLRLMLYATKEILCCKEPYEVLYGTSLLSCDRSHIFPAKEVIYNVYRKPIVISAFSTGFHGFTGCIKIISKSVWSRQLSLFSHLLILFFIALVMMEKLPYRRFRNNSSKERPILIQGCPHPMMR